MNEKLAQREGWPGSHLYKPGPVKQFAVKTKRLHFPWIQTGFFSYTALDTLKHDTNVMENEGRGSL